MITKKALNKELFTREWTYTNSAREAWSEIIEKYKHKTRYINSGIYAFKNEIFENQFLFKKYLNELDLETRKKLMGVELYLDKLAQSNQTKMEDIVDERYSKSLHKPHTSLEIEHQELIWKLLTKITPVDPLHLYWYDKEKFYEEYKKWKPGYQDWVIETISKAISH